MFRCDLEGGHAVFEEGFDTVEHGFLGSGAADGEAADVGPALEEAFGEEVTGHPPLALAMAGGELAVGDEPVDIDGFHDLGGA